MGLLPGGFRYTEEEIMAVYEDLLAIPGEERAGAEAEEDKSVPPLEIVQATLQRLSPEQSPIAENVPSQQALINRLEQFVRDRRESVRPDQSTIADAVSQSTYIASTITEQEWQSLIQLALDEGDITSAEKALNLIQVFDSSISEECLNLVLAHHANNGDVVSADKFIQNSLAEVPTQRQRDLHIKSYLQAARSAAFPTQALHLLHDYELRNLAPPQKTYARVVGHLLQAGSSVAHAHAWDLFSHMRYVAHPTPDAFMYTRMIKACSASAILPTGEPERALDLWTEMTVDKRIPPTAEAYTATIRACARSGRKPYVLEAFRLAKEMMDSHRDARGMSAFSPNSGFFSALLQGAKRIGDLGKVRWILAEMVNNSLLEGSGGNRDREQGVRVAEDAIVKENVMVHVFHAYAAYKPPFKRSMAPIVVAEEGEGAKDVTEKELETTGSEKDGQDIQNQEAQETSGDLVQEEHIRFAQVPPQTHAEVIQEAEALFSRIIADQEPSVSVDSQETSPAVFRRVDVTPRLVNAYLSVHYAHSSVNAWQNIAITLHGKVGTTKNAWSYVELLERCSIIKKGPERLAALKLAEQVWQEWSTVEKAWREGSEEEIAARQVERVYSAMIKILSLAKELDSALDHVRAFVEAYPPSAIREPMERSPLLSTRTSLVGGRPLVRLMNSAEVPDDTVPPLLTFTEIESLHHRLVVAGRVKDIKYLKWVCKSYEGALRARRDAAMRGQATEADSAEAESDNN
ncbi:hypothetical protein BDY19DRAFT_884752 [Irpex rosettiformis]|uniref:Uncharacterized protein n=1 Tax=Irpex rosettiformis TaxID=378272 RepID=A0ACB8UE58_9APHY|nr:hypothetical protein BDY19DRAFT_884752 [Irpex rosettiformis]